MEPFLPNMYFNTTKDLKANSKIMRLVEERIIENHTGCFVNVKNASGNDTSKAWKI